MIGKIFLFHLLLFVFACLLTLVGVDYCVKKKRCNSYSAIKRSFKMKLSKLR
ncbi:hypothetical protein GBN23_06350 [Plesiomonas shigelloides]|nr:hypothetical protein GBN23_06350 [Plesiomonas shigelloides]